MPPRLAAAAKEDGFTVLSVVVGGVVAGGVVAVASCLELWVSREGGDFFLRRLVVVAAVKGTRHCWIGDHGRRVKGVRVNYFK